MNMNPECIKSKNDYAEMSAILRAMAHPVRLQMLLGLSSNECNVNRMWQRLKISQPLASQHLIRMRRAGLLTAERRGKEICYKVKDARVKALLQRMCELFGVQSPQKFSKEE